MVSRHLLGLDFAGFPRCMCVFSPAPPCHPPSLADWSHPHIVHLNPKEQPDVTESSSHTLHGYRNASSPNPSQGSERSWAGDSLVGLCTHRLP